MSERLRVCWTRKPGCSGGHGFTEGRNLVLLGDRRWTRGSAQVCVETFPSSWVAHGALILKSPSSGWWKMMTSLDFSSCGCWSDRGLGVTRPHTFPENHRHLDTPSGEIQAGDRSHRTGVRWGWVCRWPHQDGGWRAKHTCGKRVGGWGSSQ